VRRMYDARLGAAVLLSSCRIYDVYALKLCADLRQRREAKRRVCMQGIEHSRERQPPFHLDRSSHAGRAMSYALAKKGQQWRAAAAARMPEARGDIRQIVGQPVFVPLYNLFLAYGKVRGGAPPDGRPARLQQRLPV